MKNTELEPIKNVQTTDHNQERLEQLKKIMPDIFTNEGRLNIDELKKIIEPQNVHETERYEFRWFGKTKAKRDAYTPTTATLSFDEKRSYNHQNTQNIIIEGENLTTLKLLTEGYRNQIKCIYIDPPYNTGKDFVYSDNFNQDKKEYWEENQMTEEGVKIDTNTETDGRFHSNWLNMMFSRLLMARQLLREDGVIFISIDDNEVHHLRKICDEVFGEENFVSEIIWKGKGGGADNKYLRQTVEYIIMYCKNKEVFVIGEEEKENEVFSKFDKEKNRNYKTQLARKWGANSKRSDRPNLFYSILAPNNEEVFPMLSENQEGCWRWGKNRMQEEIDKGNVEFVKTNNEWVVYEKIYEPQEGDTNTKKYANIIEGLGNTAYGTNEIKDLFDNKIFDFPKPSTLIERLIKIANTSQNDLILDFFAGSGTTGQAVMELNQEDGGNRKFILVQLPESTDEKSEAFKAGYKKISAITIERNKRVAEKLLKESKEDATEEEKNKLGFKVFKLKKSSFPRAEFAPDPLKTDEENLELLENYISKKEAQLVTVFNKEELISEILIKNGFQLNYKLEKQSQFSKNEIYLATDPYHSYNSEKQVLICLDVTIAAETLEYFKTHIDKKLIVLERALDTTQKWNFKHYLGENFKAF